MDLSPPNRILTARIRPSLTVIIGCFLATLFIFQFIYGLAVLLPTNVNWLMSARFHWGANYLGWFFYRNEPWHFPLGTIQKLYYPVGTNVAYTDSIPLFCIFFKPFSSVLPADFQFLGIWLFLCHFLLGYYTILLMQRFRVNRFISVAAMLLAIANPMLIYRGMDPALCAHWLLVGSIYLYFSDPAVFGVKKIIRHQFILLVIAAWVHPYLTVMVYGLGITTLVKLGFFDKAISKVRFVFYLIVAAFCVSLSWLLIGIIDPGARGGLVATDTFGASGLNLNSLYNPLDFSFFISRLKWARWEQFESFMYLGMGMIVLLLFLVLSGLYRLAKPQPAMAPRRHWRLNNVNVIPLLIFSLGMALFAISPIVTYNDKVLFRLPAFFPLMKLGEDFPVSARFFWVPYYLLFLFAIIAVSRLRIKLLDQKAILILVLVIQLFDIFPLLEAHEPTRGPYLSPLDNSSWTKLMQPFDHLVFYPPFKAEQRTLLDYQDFCFLAARNRKTINLGYVYMVNDRAAQRYSDSLNNSLENARPMASNTLYVTTFPYLDRFTLLQHSGGGVLNALDGYYYLFSGNIPHDDLRMLTGALNTANKPQLDSGLAIVGHMEEFKRINSLVATTGSPLHYSIEKMDVTERSITTEGWSFIDTTSNNKGDSIYLILTANNETYMAGTHLRPRMDIAATYSRPNLENAGFEAVVFFDSLPKGDYQVGLAIKDQRGRLFWQLVDRHVTLGFHEYASPVKVRQLPPEDRINFDLGFIDSTDRHFGLTGWAAFDQQDADNARISCILKSGDNCYVVETEPVQRPDVTHANNNKYRLDNTGFKVKLMKSALSKGDYQIGLLITDTVRQREGMIFTARHIEIP